MTHSAIVGLVSSGLTLLGVLGLIIFIAYLAGRDRPN